LDTNTAEDENLPRMARLVDLESSADPVADTAAVIKNLDLVIAADTVAAHLAGALGVPVWVALDKVPHWRWLIDRDDSPWYPTMRLYRQEYPGDWTAAFRRMAGDLRKQSDDRDLNRQ
jgi:ADP-heptose:LPS heptosyltransferase